MTFLRVMTGEATGEQFTIAANETSVGRSTECDITVDDVAASGKHCAVVRDGRMFSVRDLDSTNGTLLNGRTVQDERLRPKDVITVGSVEIMFDGEDVEAPEASPGGPTPTRELPVPGTAAPEIATTVGGPSPFDVKRQKSGVWVIVALVILLGLGALLYWFISGLLRS